MHTKIARALAFKSSQPNRNRGETDSNFVFQNDSLKKRKEESGAIVEKGLECMRVTNQIEYGQRMGERDREKAQC